MDLTHSFTVPTSVEATWAHFQDIGALAECFPGAQVTAVGEDADGRPTFEGTCKVKLGPIALVYAGAGSFTESDEAAHRFVVDAKGRDKRGNGTAGAKVTVTMAAADAGSTRVEVLTDLAITGKPAQFGRGVMQDVSDKLLGQFVACLEQRLAAEAGPADQSSPPESSVSSAGSDDPAGDDRPPPSRPAPQAPPKQADDALDLGSAVLPVLLKSYGKQVAVAVLALLTLRALLRRKCRR
ncbi:MULTISPECIES: SRPBCC family protein [unclassified Nocardioides]|uniref:SRPBCC family protein n=1 Tax=unclassified Nocardioides TaxID=2615069 RepID=UPI000702C71C|nr:MULTISPECIES: SRPBCC family protein [unclassified Nocardioides]KRC55108.1 carbon monoxide dehydrogenase [Nocardioides sp. Root79]KRC72104.1 carbon monoxide dehydrogenase [Nocardioides sp. Root240]